VTVARDQKEQVVPEVGLDSLPGIDSAQLIDFTNGTIATIPWFTAK
jgi:hypothetical protein